MNWRIETKRCFNFADALTARVIQVKCFYSGAALSSQSFDLIAAKPEVF